MTNKFENLLKIDNGEEKISATAPQKIINSQSMLNEICRSLGKPSQRYKPEKTLELIKSYMKEPEKVERVLYSEISNYLFSLDDSMRGIFFTNIDKLLNYVYNDLNNCSIDTRRLIVKIYDHSQLVTYQISNATNIVANGTEKAKENIKNEIQKDIKRIEKKYITILGIFAAIVLAFVGGITFSSSVLQNMASVSVYRLFLVIDFLGFVLINVIYLLMKFIFVINDHDTEVFKIRCVNIALAVIATLIIGAYFLCTLYLRKI